ncbi:MAG: outer membrane beta-barrel family protein [Ferruginibacter sp.]
MNRFIHYTLISITLLVSVPCIAQISLPAGASRNNLPTQNMNMGHFYGKIVDATTSKSIEGASILLLQNKLDTVSKKRKDYAIATVLTNKKGEFNIENLPVMGTFKLNISSIGYAPYDQKINFDLNFSSGKPADMATMLNAVDKDLGNIKLSPDAKQLQNVTVTASAPLLQLNLDRKVYNVEKDISATGGSAVDVMKNIPSVNVDIEGNVTLRNAAPQIFVDGRPSTLTLDQIPADQIASVEIITNPSAKFDASGGGAGILNIVLKKNRKAGYNGNVRASIDSRSKPGFGGDINVKQNKVNFFAASQVGFRKSITNVTTDRTDFLDANKIAKFSQYNRPVGEGIFGFGRLGMDYFLDNRNTFSISSNLVRGEFKSRDYLYTNKDTITPTQVNNERTERKLEAKTNFKNTGVVLGFKHNFARANREMTADANYNASENTNTSDYQSYYFDGNGNAKPKVGAERATGGGKTKFLTVQTDYADPFTKTKKIETGIRGAFRNFDSWNDNYYQDISTGNYILLPAVGVKYKFNDAVYAGYATYTQQINNFSFMAGLRMESSEYKGTLITKNQSFSNKYPISFFPSVFITQKLTKKQDLQFNYSRKINRPNFFQIIPFVDFSDSLNLSIGNPDLKPEFTNLVEISYSNQYANGHSLLASAYGKYTNDLITRYQFRAPNPNPLKTDSVLFTSYANAKSTYTIGLELTGKNKIAKWWDITTNLNLYKVSIQANNLAGTDNSDLVSWFGKITNSFKLPKNYTIQLNGDYQSKTLLPANSGRGGNMGGGFGGGIFGQTQSTAQGYIKPVYGADLSIRKDFLKNNAASLTLQCSDIFRSKVSATHAENGFFIQDNFRRRDPQVIRLNFNWRFGKFDVALFKRKNLKSEMESMQSIQQVGGQ